MRAGVAVGALSALLVAVFGSLNKRLVEHADPLTVTALELGAGTLVLGALAPLMPLLAPEFAGRLLALPGLHDGILLLVLALACTLLPFEINGTYYGAQKPETYARWRDETPPGFVFTAKAPKRIMASRRLAGTGAQVQDFAGGIATLGDRLGAILWQFDRGQSPSLEALADFVALLPPEVDGLRLRHALELRDPAAFTPELLALLRRHNIALVRRPFSCFTSTSPYQASR